VYFTVVRFVGYGRVVAVFAVRRIPSGPPVVGRPRTVVQRRQRLPAPATTDGGGAAVQPSPTGAGPSRRPSRGSARGPPRAGALFVPLRRARPAHGRREEPARDEDRRRGDRVLHAGGTGRHHPDGEVYGGQAPRIQRRGGPQETQLRRRYVQLSPPPTTTTKTSL